MARVLETGAGTIDIRVCGVDDDYILDFCPWAKTSDTGSADRPVSPRYREFCAALHKAYGGHAVAAWQGTTLVAILTFNPDGAVVPPPGMDYPQPCALSADSIPAYTEALDLTVRTGVLNIGCVSVYAGDNTYRRKKIASGLVEEAMGWADARGYLCMRAFAVPRTDDPEVWDKSPAPGEAFWESVGFEPTSREKKGMVEMVRYVASLPVDPR